MMRLAWVETSGHRPWYLILLYCMDMIRGHVERVEAMAGCSTVGYQELKYLDSWLRSPGIHLLNGIKN